MPRFKGFFLLLFLLVLLLPVRIEVESTLKSAAPLTVEHGASGAIRHWLGTDTQGRDVLLSLWVGGRMALWLAICAIAVSLTVGGFLGAVAGYWGNDRWRVRSTIFWMSLLGLFVSGWICTIMWQQAVARYPDTPFGWQAVFILCCFLLIFNAFYMLGLVPYKIGYISTSNKKRTKLVKVPLDSIVMRSAEVLQSVPGLIFIFAMAALLPKITMLTMIILIGLRSWPGPARYLRAEVMKIRQMDYVQAASGLGLSDWRVLTRHVLPNAIRPVLAIAALGMGEAILLESALSFLGIGVTDVTTPTWGRMLSEAKNNIVIWWIWLPPGLLIGLIVTGLFAWGEDLLKV
jgi:peptide/nickel transport system permease protein